MSLRSLPFTLSCLRSNNDGSIAITFALTAVAVFGLTGVAVDFGRAISARSRLQAAADIAALAAVRTRSMSDQDRIAAARTAFQANIGNHFRTPVTPAITSAGGQVTVTADTTIPTSLTNLLGFSALDISAQAQATTQSGKRLEMSMMIDLTGSMGAVRGGQTKIEALKHAADDLLTILFPAGEQASDSVRIAVAPFADYVNAGEFADEATGLAATGGGYSNIANLAATRQSTFYGTYTGAISNASGSQCGSTSPTNVLAANGQSAPASVNSSGSTFSNAYCANPTTTTTTQGSTTSTPAPILQLSSHNGGVRVGLQTSNQGNTYWTGAAPGGMIKAESGQSYSRINEYWSNAWQYWNGNWDGNPVNTNSGYYVPLIQTATGLTIQSYTGHDSNGNNRTGEVGVGVYYGQSNSRPSQVKSNSSGFWNVTINTNGTPRYSWHSSSNNNSWDNYVPLYTSLNTSTSTASTTSTTTVPGCESVAQSQPQSRLITCVTERTGSQAYSGAGPSGGYVGPFNHGNTAVSNYSSDGKCWVAGRELPKIIPLTNQKSTLTSFFANATIGGATPGHLGTAWAWYMLSPNWGSVFTGASLPTAYNTQNVMKVAVLMTDGEYNIHYTSPTARDQALALCQGMKDAGITVYTVGFGFTESATASATGTTEQRAKDLLQRCASGTNKYFFPYDGTQLRRDFSAIGSALMGTLQSDTSKITH